MVHDNAKARGQLLRLQQECSCRNACRGVSRLLLKTSLNCACTSNVEPTVENTFATKLTMPQIAFSATGQKHRCS